MSIQNICEEKDSPLKRLLPEEAQTAGNTGNTKNATEARTARNGELPKKAEALNALKLISGKNIINRKTGIPALFRREQRDELISNAAMDKSKANGFTDEDHFHAAANIDSLYENASLADDRPDRDNNPDVISIKRFVAPVLLKGEFAGAYITVKETVGNRIYTMESDELKKQGRYWKIPCPGKIRPIIPIIPMNRLTSLTGRTLSIPRCVIRDC